MTENHICSKKFPEIIDFSRKFKESRTNLNVSKQLKNFGVSKKQTVILKTFPVHEIQPKFTLI